MSLLPTITPPGWGSSADDSAESATLAAFLTATDRMTKYEPERLEPLEQLSQGSTFQASVCRDTVTGDLVVVKALKANEHELSTGSSSVSPSIVQEMLISIWPPFLSHPNITQTLGFQRYLAQGNVQTMTLVLEYAELGSLGDYLRLQSSRRPTELLHRKILAMDVASGLECLHRSRVLHGDLKPDNILLFKRNPAGSNIPLIAKLADFGNAIVDDAYTKTFREGELESIYSGTPQWAPSNIIDTFGFGDFETKALCDVFSFGLVLWSIYEDQEFYANGWGRQREREESFLEKAYVSDFKDWFGTFEERVSDGMPEEEAAILLAAFNKCVEVLEYHENVTLGSTMGPGIEPKISSLAVVSEVKSILGRGLPLSTRVDSPLQTMNWFSFDMGDAHINVNDDIPWAVQTKYYDDLLSEARDPHVSKYKRGMKQLELASCSSIGFGCRKSILETLEHIHSANCLEDFVAQLTITRLFQAHGLEPPKPNNLENGVADERGNITDPLEVGTASEPGDSHSLFDRSRRALMDFKKLGLLPPQYYCWHIRTTQRLISSVTADEAFTISGQRIQGMDDCNLLGMVGAQLRRGERISIEISEADILEEDSLPHRAVITGKNHLLSNLLELGVDPNTRDDSDRTLLQIACRWGNRDAVGLLLDAGGRADIPGRGGDLPLHWIWMFGDDDIEKICNSLIERGGADVNATMNQYDLFSETWNHLRISGTALHSAIAARSLPAVLVLLDHGANINRRPYEDSETPLELAARLHLSEIVELLCSRGAALANDVDGGWALHNIAHYTDPLQRWMLHGPATEENMERVLEILLKDARTKGLAVDIKDEEGSTGLDIALREHGEEAYILAAFLKQGFRLDSGSLDKAINSCSSDEQNASKVELVLQNAPEKLFDVTSSIKVAIEKGALAALRLIVDKFGSQVLNSKDHRGQTPMHWAIYAGISSTVTYLIDKGVSLSEVDADGVPPSGRAVLLQRSTLLKVLLEAGADPKISKGVYQGSSILSFATSGRYSKDLSLIGFLLSLDLQEWMPRRFPMLHEYAILNARNERTGNTVLHEAAAAADEDAVYALLNAGAKKDIRDCAGRVPSEKAEMAILNSSGTHTLALKNILKLLESGLGPFDVQNPAVEG